MNRCVALILCLFLVMEIWAHDPVVRGLAVERLESLEYPLLAALSLSRGQVVLSCHVAEDGSVEKAVVVSPKNPSAGVAILVNAAVENAKRWRFRRSIEPGSEESPVTLIYMFRLEDVCDSPPCKSRFFFDYPNLVTVVGQTRPMSIYVTPPAEKR